MNVDDIINTTSIPKPGGGDMVITEKLVYH